MDTQDHNSEHQSAVLNPSTLDAVCDQIARQFAHHLSLQSSLLTRKDLAQRLQIGERTVSSLVARGRLPKPVRLGRTVRWDWDEVKQVLRSSQTKRSRRTRSNHSGK